MISIAFVQMVGKAIDVMKAKDIAKNTHAKMEANVLTKMMISFVNVQMVGKAVDVKYQPQQMNQPKPNQMDCAGQISVKMGAIVF